MKKGNVFQFHTSTCPRLIVRRETIAQLTSQQLERAAGGGAPGSEISCVKTVCGPPDPE